MPRSALLCTKIEIREPAYTCDLKIECSERKRGAAAKMHFATAPFCIPNKRDSKIKMGLLQNSLLRKSS